MRRYALTLALFLSPSALAADLFVGPGNHATILSAVQSAAAGDVIWIDPGTWVEQIDIGSTDLTFRANGGTVTWRAPAGDSVLRANGAALTVVEIDFGGGLARRAIEIQAGTLTVERCAFADGTSTDMGGAIRAVNTNSTVTDSSFTGNGVDNGGGTTLGGAIYALQGTLTVSGSTFTGNATLGLGEGGAIYAEDAAVTVDRSSFDLNSADFTGGAIDAFNADLVLSDSVFANNNSEYGGAVSCDQATSCSVTGSTFRENSVTGESGAVELYFGAGLDVRGNLFCDNVASGFPAVGGAMGLYGSAATVRNNVFATSIAEAGGAVVVNDAGVLLSQNNTFAGGLANLEGGAIYLIDGDMTTTNDMFAWNTVAYFGGEAVHDLLLPPTFNYALFWANSTNNHNGVSGLGVIQGLDPMIASWPTSCAWTDFVPLVGSPMIDAGDPLISDPDASRSDIGALGGPGAPLDRVTDDDGDGWVLYDDCDDTDPNVNPGAAEICDGGGVDENCNGLADDADPTVSDAVTTWPDADGDGDGDYWSAPATTCAGPGRVENMDDCFDADPAMSAGPDWWMDADGDFLGDPSTLVSACENPGQHVNNDLDCDDADPAVGVPGTWYPDADFDGFGATASATVACDAPLGYVPAGGDCDDTEPAAYPGAPEVCDTIDNDCDGLFDDDDPDVDLSTAMDWYTDADGDGFGAGPPAAACTQPPDTSAVDGDCDDADPAEFPGGLEICDGADNDCNGVVDDNAWDAPTFYPDADGDGWGTAAGSVTSCLQPGGTALLGGDCDEGDTAINPGADEVCDGVDNDCEGTVDEGASDAVRYYEDADGDGFGGVDADYLDACAQPPGYVLNDEDCNDALDTSWPGAPELCNGFDDDCDGENDEGLPLADFWPDADGDGYGDQTAGPTQACGPEDGEADNDLDCDDSNPEISPSATDIAGNGIDEDCDGADTPGDTTRDPGPVDPDDSKPPGGAGCSCATGSSTPYGLWLVAPVLLLLTRRR